MYVVTVFVVVAFAVALPSVFAINATLFFAHCACEVQLVVRKLVILAERISSEVRKLHLCPLAQKFAWEFFDLVVSNIDYVYVTQAS